MKLADALTKLDAIVARLSTGNSGDKSGDVSREIASLREELVKGVTAESTKEAVAREVANLVQAGELVKKEDVQAKVDAATKELNDKHEAEKKLEAKRTERLEKVRGLGIDLSYRYDEAVETDTIQSHLDSIGLDENGDKEFDRAYKLWGRMAKEAKESDEGSESAESADKLEPALANSGKGGKKVSTGKTEAKKPNNLLVGSSRQDDDELENNNANAGDEDGPNPRGRARFAKRTK